jgi:prepilin-type N-terminal cleavage/methylation domain-containing protein
MKPFKRRASKRKGPKDESGMTMIELVISMVVVGLISVTMVPFFKINLQSYLKARNGKNVIQSSRIAFSRMINDLKQLNTPLDIWYASSSRIDVDVPNDGLAAITYRYDSSDEILYRDGVKLAEGVQSLTFTYFTDHGTQKGVPFYFDSDTWLIQVDMAVGDDANRLNLREMISPRNFQLK